MSDLAPRTSLGLSPQAASTIAYLLGWITGLVVLLLERENPRVRFHAAQSLVTFLGLGVLQVLFNVVPLVGTLLALLVVPVAFVLWVVLLYNAWTRPPEQPPLRIPLAAEFADRIIGAA